MMHTKRKWCVTEVESAEELARLLTESTFGGCQAFSVRGHPNYVWVNDSTCSDRLQEYAVLKLNTPDGVITQIESITTSWCKTDEMLQFITRTLAGEDDNSYFSGEVTAILQTPQEHGRCQHCA